MSNRSEPAPGSIPGHFLNGPIDGSWRQANFPAVPRTMPVDPPIDNGDKNPFAPGERPRPGLLFEHDVVVLALALAIEFACSGHAPRRARVAL